MTTLLASWQRGWSAAGEGPGTGLADAGLTLQVRANGTAHADAVPVRGRVAGPGDVVGLDAGVILRTQPPENDSLGADKLAFVEVVPADLPWAVSPVPADSGTPVQPWLALLVVPETSVELRTTPGGEIVDVDASLLPAVGDLHAFAHVQDDGGRRVARLIAPVALKPGVRYCAVLVPTFEEGRRAGLRHRGGSPPDTAVAADAPAWSGTDSTVSLPVFLTWSFHAVSALALSERVEALRRPSVPGLGWRTVHTDAGALGLDDVGAHPVPGVLVPPGEAPTPAWTDEVRTAFQADLAAVLDADDDESADHPVVGPPLRGPGVLGRTLEDGTAVDTELPWCAALNLQPAWRIAAGVGEALVRHNQEAYVLPIQQRLPVERVRRDDGRHGLGSAITRTRAGAGPQVHSGLALLLGRTTDTHAASDAIPAERRHPALRRALRPGAGLGRQLSRVLGHSVGTTAYAFDLHHGRPRSFLTDDGVRELAEQTGTEGGSLGAFQVPRDNPGRDDTHPPEQSTPSVPTPVDGRLAGVVARQALVDSLGLLDARLEAAHEGRERWAPVSDRALLDDLAAWDPSWVLPGVERVPSESVLVLQPHTAFVEALMLAANEELIRELRWREIPFRSGEALLPSFWRPGSADLDLGMDWTTDALGEHAAGSGTWLLIRSSLWRLCPDLVVQICAARFDGDAVVPDAGTDAWSAPVQEIRVRPDTLLLELDLSVEALVGSDTDPGSFLVFSEPSAGASFGLRAESPGPLVPKTTGGGHTEAAERSDPPDEVWVHAGRFVLGAS